MGQEARTEVRVSDTPETDAFFKEVGWKLSGLVEMIKFCKRLERERNIALAAGRKYLNVPELKDFPNVEP